MNNKRSSIKSDVWRLIFIPSISIIILIAISLTYLCISQINKFIDLRGSLLAQKTAHLLHSESECGISHEHYLGANGACWRRPIPSPENSRFPLFLQGEGQLDGDERWYRPSAPAAWTEAPLLHGTDRLAIEPEGWCE